MATGVNCVLTCTICFKGRYDAMNSRTDFSFRMGRHVVMYRFCGFWIVFVGNDSLSLSLFLGLGLGLGSDQIRRIEKQILSIGLRCNTLTCCENTILIVPNTQNAYSKGYHTKGNPIHHSKNLCYAKQPSYPSPSTAVSIAQPPASTSQPHPSALHIPHNPQSLHHNYPSSHATPHSSAHSH